jgi:DNA-binding phage protein
MERLVNYYVQQLFSKKHTLDQYTVEQMIDDENTIRDFFEKHLRKQSVDQRLQIITDLRDMLDA